ncbi:MAG TPA: hypothetical protein VF120_01430 [Ktedonobacterales bacterium]
MSGRQADRRHPPNRTGRRSLDSGDERGTVVLPMVTLPSLPRIPHVAPLPADDHDWDESDDARARDEWDDAPPLDEWEDEKTALAVAASARGLPMRKPVSSRVLDVLLVPGKGMSKRASAKLVTKPVASGKAAGYIRAHRPLLVAVTILAVLSATLVTVSGAGFVGQWSNRAWSALAGAGPAPTATPIPAPDVADAGHYVNKYGFDWPTGAQALPDDERQRMVFMLPYAYRATSAYDNRYHASIEPEMIVWWTHAEGIGARINYSNCANHSPRPGTNYFSNIENCPQANFWQLGYGNQFSVIYVLKNAFTDLYGNTNDPRLVQKVGQWVLDFDAKQGTVPACGGYSCTFPAMTIDQIMSGVDQTTGVVNANNWWASVLSRDPAINCYMIAHALTFFNHEATRNWVGCYYYEPCWGYESNRLGDILAAWPSLRTAAGL